MYWGDLLQQLFIYRDFAQFGRFLGPKSSFFDVCHELPQYSDPNSSEAKKRRFSSIASMQHVFRGIFVIFVGSASRIFRKITILNTVLNTVLRWVASAAVYFFVISTSSDDFWLQNRYFSTSVANCLNTVIRTVRKLKNNDFRQLPQYSSLFDEFSWFL